MKGTARGLDFRRLPKSLPTADRVRLAAALTVRETP